MNLGDVEVQSVPRRTHELHHVGSDVPVTPIQIRLDRDRSQSGTSENGSEAPTVIRWATPPLQAPSPPRRNETTHEWYDEDDDSYDSNEEAVYSSSGISPSPNFMRRGPRQSLPTAPPNSALVPPNPPIRYPMTPVDDTPYIQYAIDSITSPGGRPFSRTPPPFSRTPSSEVLTSHAMPIAMPITVPQQVASAASVRAELALARQQRSSPEQLFRPTATRPLSIATNTLGIESSAQNTPSFDVFLPVDMPPRNLRYPRLTNVPMIIRPFSMFMLTILCLLMIAALVFCSIYSTSHDGITPWVSITGWKYFVFGFLPQLLAAGILLYVQCVMDAMRRILPFTLMAMENSQKRMDALFLGIFPRTMLWPVWIGHLAIDLANSLFWFTIWTIPLQSCLFAVVHQEGGWRWAATQGVVWTLVAIYFGIILGTICVTLFFARRVTGLMWDPTTLADIFALLPRSNSLKDYTNTDLMRTRKELEHRLQGRSDRLGWWRTPNPQQGLFYCFGEIGATNRRSAYDDEMAEKSRWFSEVDHMTEMEKRKLMYSPETRFRYLPWYLRDTPVLLWAISAFVVLVVLIVVSFLPTTAIRDGFAPGVIPGPRQGDFSPANFLYSFVPAILGMLLYEAFRRLDMMVRQLQPWSELAKPHGATATESLLLSYSSDLPVLCTIRALRLGHYRVAAMSFLSFSFLGIPIVAGGLFFPLTTRRNGVRMIPNLPAFYVLIALLVLYVLGLILLLPRRTSLSLPHSVDTLAEIISFVYASEILEDAQFRGPRSKSDLVGRLEAMPARAGPRRYGFGVYTGRFGRECLGVERVDRAGQRVMMLG